MALGEKITYRLATHNQAAPSLLISAHWASLHSDPEFTFQKFWPTFQKNSEVRRTYKNKTFLWHGQTLD